MVYEIHTYGGGEFLVTILIAIKLLLGGSAYLTLIKAMAVLGLIIFIGWIVFSFRFQLSWLLWFALAYLGFFVPKVDVSVIDHLRPADTQVVTGVPALLGYVGHLSSALGDALTRLMEQAFSLPGDIEFRTAGYATSLHVVRAGLLEQIPEPYVAGSASRYIRDCVLYDLLDGTKAVNAVLTSPDLLAAFASDHPSRFTETHIAGDGTEIQGTPEVVTCAEGYSRLTAGLNAVYTGWWGRFVQALAGARGLQPAAVDSVMTTSYQSLMNVAATPQAILFQSAMIHSFDEAIQLQAKLTGSDAYLVGLTLAQAQYQQRSALFTMGQLAQRLLPVLRSAVEGLLYGLFPLLMLLLFTPLGPMVLKTYGIGFLWLQCWGPLFAILNLLTAVQAERMLAAYTSAGITLATYRTLEVLTADGLAIAGALSLAVPVIAWALASGTFAGLSQAVGSVTGSAQSAAGAAAASAGMGNLSTGNVSLSNLLANKFNPAAESTTGITFREYGTVVDGGHAPARYGYVTPSGGATQLAVSSLGGALTVQAGRQSSQELRHAYQDTYQRAQEAFQVESAQFHSALTQQAERHTAAQSEHSVGRTAETGRSAEAQRTVAAVDRAANQLSEKFGFSADQARTIAERALLAKAVDLKGGGSLSGPSGLGGRGVGFNVGASASATGIKNQHEDVGVTAKEQQAFEHVYSAVTDQEARDAYAVNEQARTSSQGRHGHAATTGSRFGVSASSGQESQRSQGLRDLVSQLASLSIQMRESEGKSVTLNQDQTAALVRHISRETGKSESYVATKIGDAMISNSADRTAIGDRSVAQWAQSWFDQSRPTEQLFGIKGFQDEISRTIDTDRGAVRDAAGRTEGTVSQGQDHTRSGVASAGASTRQQARDVQTQAEHQAASTMARVDAGEKNAEQAQDSVGQHGGQLVGRVQEFQRGTASLAETTAEGIRDLNPFRNEQDTRVNKSRERLFEDATPHPNFYPESRLKALDRVER
ncbi:MAG: conjugal transfer protein TraG N-terminal domain-containing protein [Nitrospirota bacterium]